MDCLKNPELLKITLKQSKTDPFRVGVDVFVGRTNYPLCTVAAVLSYLVSRVPKPGPLFILQNGKPLKRASFVAELKEALEQLGAATITWATASGVEQQPQQPRRE